MIVFRQPDELRDWRVVFFERATFWWARFVPGRFKHVAAYARSEACRTTVIYDVTLDGTRVYVLPDGPAGDGVLLAWLAGTTVLRPSPASGEDGVISSGAGHHPSALEALPKVAISSREVIAPHKPEVGIPTSEQDQSLTPHKPATIAGYAQSLYAALQRASASADRPIPSKSAHVDKPAAPAATAPASPFCRPIFGFYCVPAIRHLIGARCGAVTPTGLYRALVEQGAEIVSHGEEHGAADAEHPVDPYERERAGG